MSRGRALLLGGAALVFLVVVGGWWLLATESGLRTVWAWSSGRLPSTLTVHELRGRTVGPVSLIGVEYRTPTLTASVDSLRVDWSPLALVRRTLLVERLQVDGVQLRRSASAPSTDDDTSPLPEISIPVRVLAPQVVIRGVAVEDPARSLAWDSVRVTNLAAEPGAGVEATVEFRGPPGHLGLDLDVVPAGTWPLRLGATFDLTLDTLPRVAGRLDLDGALTDSTRFFAETTAPWIATASGSIADLFTDPFVSVNATLTDAAFDVAGGVVVSAEANAAGVLDSLRATAAATVDVPEAGRVSLTAGLARAGDQIEILRSEVRVAEGVLETRGTVTLGDGAPAFDVTTRWSALRWPLADSAAVRSPRGEASLRGTADAYAFDVRATAQNGTLPPVDLSARGDGTRSRATVSLARVTHAGRGPGAGELRASGRVEWDPEPRWDLAFAGVDIDVGDLPVDSIWTGLLSFDGHTRGSAPAAAVVATVQLDTLSGTLRDRSIGASTMLRARVPRSDATLRTDDTEIELSWLDVAWGDGRAFASGVIADTLGLHWTVDVPDLGAAVPDAAGRLETAGRVTGSRRAPVVTGTAEIDSLVTPEIEIANARMDASGDPGTMGDLRIRLDATGLRVGERTIDTVVVEVDGAPARHGFSARARAPEGLVTAGGHGGFDETGWMGVLTAFTVTEDRVGGWALVDSANLRVGDGSLRLDSTCLGQDAARLCAGASLDGTVRSARVSLTGLPTGRIADLLGRELAADGETRLEAEIDQTADGILTGRLDARIDDGTLRYPTANGEGLLRHSGTHLTGRIGPDGAVADFEALVSDERRRPVASITGTVELPGVSGSVDDVRAERLVGRIAADVEDVGLLDLIATGERRTGGSLRIDTEVSGTVAQPAFIGEARLRDGFARLPALGISADSIQITAGGRGMEGVDLTGTARLGEGPLTIEGFLPAEPTAARPARVTVRGDGLQAVDLPEASVRVATDLSIEGTPDRIDVRGRIDVERARLEIEEIPETAARPSRDVVFVGDTIPTASGLPELGMQLTVQLGDSASFRGFGLTADPRGEVTLSTGAGGTILASGSVTLENGRYRAYGQQLTMERGRFVYAGGAADNPGLDIRASRTARDSVVAGVTVTGTLRRPVLEVFSEPAMLESDALSYLLIGRSIASATGEERASIEDAATTLGVRGGAALANRLGERIGLADVRVSADGPVEEASLIAGRFLSPRLYVSYGVGLFEPISTFRVRYLLSSRWTLNTESGRSTGIDLMYRVERR